MKTQNTASVFQPKEKSTHISFRITNPTLKEAKAIARQARVSFSAVMNVLVAYGLEAWKVSQK